MYEEIEILQNEVDTVVTQIEEICKTDKEVDSLYLGTQIFFSPLKPQQMDLFFIGINPGCGSYKYSGSKPRSIIPLEKSGYETEEFSLQDDWLYIFGEKEKINNLDLLYQGFKTNCSFISTTDSEALRKLKSILKYKYKMDLSSKEREWIRTLIAYVEPRIIICEGFGAFDSLSKMYSLEEFKISENEKQSTHKIAYLNKYIPVLGFKRLINSRFKDPEDVVETLLEKMEDAELI